MFKDYKIFKYQAEKVLVVQYTTYEKVKKNSIEVQQNCFNKIYIF